MISRSGFRKIKLCFNHIQRTSSHLASTQTAAGFPISFVPSTGTNYNVPASVIAMGIQRRLGQLRPSETPKATPDPKGYRRGTNEEILDFEAAELLARPPFAEVTRCSLQASGETATVPSTENSSTSAYEQVELEIEELSSTGDGLARSPVRNVVYVVPFTVKGDRVMANVRRSVKDKGWSHADLIAIKRPSPQRDGVTPTCKHFASCSGCQLQMLPYHSQLAHKRTIIEKAFRDFSDLSPNQVPPVGETGPSPLQYGYRTKLTPHFDGPPRGRKGEERNFLVAPKFGFTRKNWRRVMDIETCPIGTEIVQRGLERERAKVAADFQKYHNGATILIRESTKRFPKSENQDSLEEDSSPTTKTSLDDLPEPISKTFYSSLMGPELTITYPTHVDFKTYTTNNDADSIEHISSYTFTSRAGSFFQNNNSILPSFLRYVRAHATVTKSGPPIKYLLDAYCGSGLFAVTLAPLFVSGLGIDLDPWGVEAARMNAEQNGVDNVGFIAADAMKIFADVPYPHDETLVVIDPPRKGASVDFLRQLCDFGPQRVVYVSCNVHTQARDVGMMVRGFGLGWKYEIESLRGFDFFPQTSHVEGLCILNRVGEREEPAVDQGQHSFSSPPAPSVVPKEEEEVVSRSEDDSAGASAPSKKQRVKESNLRDAIEELEALSKAGRGEK